MGGLPLRTPTHRRPGGPSPRLLPNGTHAHPPADRSLSPENHAAPWRHGALIRLSPGCAPLAGRSHTRYSPVRRSPPGRHRPALPLDLHVLSLSLAFILSQDQTLHCNFYLMFFEPGFYRFPCPPAVLLHSGGLGMTCSFVLHYVSVCQSSSHLSRCSLF